MAEEKKHGKYDTIIFEPGPVTRIIHDEPDIRNPLTGKFILEFKDALQRLQRDKEARVGVILATGPVFCAGHNLGFVSTLQEWKPSEPSVLWEEDWRAQMDFMRDNLYYPLWDCTIPLVVGVQGGAYTGGVEFTMMCDIVVAAEGTVFDYGTAHVTGIGNENMLLYHLGWRRALEVYLTGWNFTAEDAERWGAVNKVVPQDQLETEVMRYANLIARMPPEAPRLIKENLKFAMNQMGARNAIFFGTKTNILGHLASVTPREKEFYTIMKKQGMRAGLEFRDKPFEELGYTRKPKPRTK
ncbi:MAG: enoyl-CoA hydratase-related protein [Dehalococcoidia bacterium]|nr:enoyl-CoA hydratase-related protein [Dehalococcoidia bacterium]